jgi:hypothetical protein
MNRRLLLIFVMMLSLLPAFYLATLHTVDPFLYTPLSEVSKGATFGELSEINEDQPSYVVILYTISSLCNIPPLQLAYLPIGAIIFPFCIYALSRRIIDSKIIPILLLLYFAFDFSIYQGQYSVLAYAWAHPLFFIFILLYFMHSSSEKRNPRLVALILLTFTCIVFLHPTYVFWAISFAVGLNVIIAITKSGRFPNVKLTPTPFLTISLFVIYFGFNQVYFGFYLHRVLLVEPEMISEQFISMLRGFLGLSAPLTSPYQIWVGAPTAIIGYAAFARTSILVLCLLLGMGAWIKKNHRNMGIKFDTPMVLIIALLIAGAMHTIGYAFYGHISMRFMILLFPVTAVFLMKKAGLRRSINLFVALIILLAFAQTASYVTSNPEVNNLDVQLAPYSNWLIAHKTSDVVLLSDFSTSQLTNYYFETAGESMTQRFYYSEFYSSLVSGDEEIVVAEFVALNWGEEVTLSVGWATFEPVRDHSVEISENVHLNRIYDDGLVSLMRSNFFK